MTGTSGNAQPVSQIVLLPSEPAISCVLHVLMPVLTAHIFTVFSGGIDFNCRGAIGGISTGTEKENKTRFKQQFKDEGNA